MALSGTAMLPTTLRVHSGRIWLTVEGQPADHWLESGHSMTLEPGRLVVIETDRPGSRICLRQQYTSARFPTRLRPAAFGFR
jgi:hypothetical protein